MAEYKGIDVSSNNGTVKWANVKNAGYDFAIIRVGYGRYKQDTQLANNIAGVKAQGLKYGVYHYSYALNAAQAKEEAAFVIKTLKQFDLDLAFPVWFDMEDADGYKKKNGLTINKANITAICKAFVEAMRDAGYKVGVYASKSWFDDYINAAQLGDCYYWLAQWASKPTWSGDYMVWQYSDSGKISGCSGAFDLNIAYKYLNTHVVTAMQNDSSCKNGVVRYAGVACDVYQEAQLVHVVASLVKGDPVNYFGNYCTIDGEKYAYVSTTSGSGYVKASCLRTAKP